MRASDVQKREHNHLADYQQRASRLQTHAWVFYKADTKVGALFLDDARRERNQLAARVRDHDIELSLWARACFRGDPHAAEELAAISRNHGRRDDANDVVALVEMFRHGIKLGLSVPVSEAQLDAAEADAKLQLELLSGEIGSAARDLAARAYTRWHQDYEKLRVLGRFLTHDEPNSHKMFPGVRMVGSRRAVEADEQVVEADEALAAEPDAVIEDQDEASGDDDETLTAAE